jgi:predicted transcriptional regulator of viral defense system
MVSDPTRTIVDMLSDPRLGGGIRPVVDVFQNYLKSEHKDLKLLLTYAEQLGNGAVFKRLGFLLERNSPEEKEIIATLTQKLTKGNAKLDPSLKEDKLVTRWKLWIPEGWAKKEGTVD